MSASLLLQISPVGVVLLAILAFKRPPVQAAILGVLLVLALWVAGGGLTHSMTLLLGLLPRTLQCCS